MTKKIKFNLINALCFFSLTPLESADVIFRPSPWTALETSQGKPTAIFSALLDAKPSAKLPEARLPITLNLENTTKHTTKHYYQELEAELRRRESIPLYQRWAKKDKETREGQLHCSDKAHCHPSPSLNMWDTDTHFFFP